MRFFLEIPKVLFPIWLNFIVVEDWEDFSISPRNYVRDLLYFYSWFRIFFLLSLEFLFIFPVLLGMFFLVCLGFIFYFQLFC